MLKFSELKLGDAFEELSPEYNIGIYVGEGMAYMVTGPCKTTLQSIPLSRKVIPVGRIVIGNEGTFHTY